jgi:hypothetical protein
MGCTVEGSSSNPGKVKGVLFSTSSNGFWSQPPIEWATETLSPGVKRPGREANRSFLTSAEFKNTWIYTSTPPYAFMM